MTRIMRGSGSGIMRTGEGPVFAVGALAIDDGAGKERMARVWHVYGNLPYAGLAGSAR